MRTVLALLAIAAGTFLFLAPARAEAADRGSFQEFVAAKHAPPSSPKSPVEQPADWIAVGGILCYAIIPVVLVVGLGVIAYQVWLRNADSSLLGASASDAWLYRDGARHPPGLVLLAF